eukprot:COSAG01_NODE_62856_length_282_cov_1.409836_1_plen_61_part_10
MAANKLKKGLQPEKPPPREGADQITSCPVCRSEEEAPSREEAPADTALEDKLKIELEELQI